MRSTCVHFLCASIAIIGLCEAEAQTVTPVFTDITPTSLAIYVDLTGDNVFDSSDLAKLIGDWGSSDMFSDLDNDGVVGSSDLALLVGLWGPADLTSRGAAWGDFNNDGFLDIYVTQWLQLGNLLLINDGAGYFNQVVDLAASVNVYGGGVALGDFDNDGFLDVHCANTFENLLLKNHGGVAFSNDATSFVAGNYLSRGNSWADYDLDGDIDLYVANMNGTDNKSRLFRNDGGGMFTLVSQSTPLGNVEVGRQPAWADYDNDGDPDVMLVNGDAGEGPVPGLTNRVRLFRNDGGTFVDVSTSVMLDIRKGRGAAWGDFDNDGDLDVVVTQVIGDNFLFRNDGGDVFTDITSLTPIGPGGASRGCAWVDYDNDGDLDLHISNIAADNLYRNDGLDMLGNPMFLNIAVPPITTLGNARASSWGDYDNDGDMDLLTATQHGPKVMRNDSVSRNNWLQLDLRGTVSNRSAIGARVELTVDGETQIREVTAGSSYLGMDSLTVEFGLANATMVDEVVIRWPSGIVQSIGMITPNQRMEVFEEASNVVYAPNRVEADSPE